MKIIFESCSFSFSRDFCLLFSWRFSKYSPSRTDPWAPSHFVPNRKLCSRGQVTWWKSWSGKESVFWGDIIFPLLTENLLSGQNVKLMLCKFTLNFWFYLWMPWFSCDWSCFRKKVTTIDTIYQWWSRFVPLQSPMICSTKAGTHSSSKVFWRLHHRLPVDPVQKL